MNQKQALAALKLGLKVCRGCWYYAAYLEIKNSKIVCRYTDGTFKEYPLSEFLTQEHDNWQIYDESKTSNGSTSIRAEGT